ncbi:MAG: hypothetical protein ACK553_01390 [Planctomycetota bacterium]
MPVQLTLVIADAVTALLQRTHAQAVQLLTEESLAEVERQDAEIKSLTSNEP